MKTIRLILAGMMLLAGGAMQAQVSVNVNIGVPPPWGPVGFTDVRYYYLPDVEAYYDVHSSVFIYYTGGVWVHRAYLPGMYRNYDLYGGYKVVMRDYHGTTPYKNFKEYKKKYAKGYHGGAQKTIGERPGKGNGVKNTHDGNHENKDKGHGNDYKSGHSNDKGNYHGNEKGTKSDQGHDGGKGKKK